MSPEKNQFYTVSPFKTSCLCIFFFTCYLTYIFQGQEGYDYAPPAPQDQLRPSRYAAQLAKLFSVCDMSFYFVTEWTGTPRFTLS